MPEIRPDQPLLPSVLDRLIDHEPEVRREAPRSRNQLLRDLKQSVRRDLENLLNTRIRCVPTAPELKHLKKSLVNYGIPDMTGASPVSPKDREEFRKTIETVLRQYETRLKKLRVKLIDTPQAIDRTIRFHIDAMLQAEPAPEPIAFDSTLRLADGSFEVKGEANA
ncbi:MAG TPA: type VI secretion system baseplate subunit TssE [Isosphaeraceae bacterium]|nr:type VI secretion system baseplate subunit TssE [Isosphaeraceae bacterium]